MRYPHPGVLTRKHNGISLLVEPSSKRSFLREFDGMVDETSLIPLDIDIHLGQAGDGRSLCKRDVIYVAMSCVY